MGKGSGRLAELVRHSGSSSSFSPGITGSHSRHPYPRFHGSLNELNSLSLQSPSGAPLSLLTITLRCLVKNIHHVQSLRGIPEDIVMLLFLGTLQRGALTEPLLRIFLATNHSDIAAAVDVLGIKFNVKPVVPTRCSDR
eukprot:TRINITY_DN8500_c2_g1_i1.p1 TRINITY_DN8500_c2_g1~~TRINITY_DN8500_c2_g1_i1.p1  ORF type:complete len:139 (-),score=14.27 TRINITY_DN8500_c2_g1_i1:425-841(-)